MAQRQRFARLGFEPSAVAPERADALPLPALFDEFIAGYAYTGSPRTYRHYQMYIGRGFAPWLDGIGVKRLDQIAPKHIERYLGECSQRLAPVTVRKIYNQIHRFLEWCRIDRGYSPNNPCARVRPPSVPEGTRQGFADDELRRISQATNSRTGVTGIRDRAILSVLLDTGARASELCNMRVSDVDWPRHRILIHLGKGGRDRWVTIGAETQRRLRTWLHARYPVSSDALWLTQRRDPFTYQSLSKNLELLGEYAGVEDLTPHRFRHTFATQFYRAHRDIIALQTLLGHSSIEITMKYLRQLGVNYGAEQNYRTPSEWLLK